MAAEQIGTGFTPSKKSTVPPVGKTPGLTIVVDVKVTRLPAPEGLPDVITVVVVATVAVSATSVANGVSTTPEKAMLSTVHPAAPTLLSLAARNRT